MVKKIWRLYCITFCYLISLGCPCITCKMFFSNVHIIVMSLGPFTSILHLFFLCNSKALGEVYYLHLGKASVHILKNVDYEGSSQNTSFSLLSKTQIIWFVQQSCWGTSPTKGKVIFINSKSYKWSIFRKNMRTGKNILQVTILST